MTRQPVIFIPHGGGPWPWVPSLASGMQSLREYLVGLASDLPEAPKAILVVSAHWEAPKPTLMTSAQPPMLYDYSGFPPETYEVQWPASGAPELAGRVESLLAAAGLPCSNDARRGFDHGTFVPLALSFPRADVPTLQLSLLEDLDPAQHLALGRALASLRDEGVLIVGSGMSYHNLGAFRRLSAGDSAALAESRAFDEWLAESVLEPAEERAKRLTQWAEAPAARACHPREEHLLPLHVCAGAALEDSASIPYRAALFGARVSAVQFG